MHFARSWDARVLSRLPLLMICFVLTAFCATQVVAQEKPTDGAASKQKAIVLNGSFEDFDGGIPSGWKVDNGAGSGSKPFSILKKGADGGVELAGDGVTNTWKFLSQKIDVKPGVTYQLDFKAKANGLNRENGQNNNCYVGVFSSNERGKIVSQSQASVSSEDWRDEVIYFGVPKDAAKTEVWIFLSMTGTLSVKQLSAEPSVKNSFDILVDDMDQNYSYFEHKKIDWKALAAKYRNQAKTDDSAKFVKVLTKMLAELKDAHVWIIHNGKQVNPFQKRKKLNLDFKYVSSQLKDMKQVRGFCVTGRTQEGFGYVLIESMSGINDQQFKEIANNVRDLWDTPAMIVDFRVNGGGQEPVGQKLAGMFCEKEHVYAIRKARSGEKHSDFSEGRKTVLRPWRLNKNDEAYTKPIICLQGNGAVSSGEGFTLMMKAIPHCTTIGQPTRGASGNPSPVKLPNGVEVWYSRWVAMDADGNTIEDVGVQPDITVRHTNKGDKTFDKAIKMLQEKTEK